MSKGTGTGDYENAFETKQYHVNGVVLTNTDPKANWVEFGAHAGGKTPVLNYRPLTTAMDEQESNGPRGFLPRDIFSPRTTRMGG
jgi:hypothetical protein